MKSTSTAELGAKRSDWEDTFDLDRRYEDILVAKGSVLVTAKDGHAKSIADESFTASQMELPPPQQLHQEPTVDTIVREKAEVERQLAEEQARVAALTEQLESAVRRLADEREDLIAQVAEVHQAEADRRDLEIKRMSQRNAKLARQLVREQAIVRFSMYNECSVEGEHSGADGVQQPSEADELPEDEEVAGQFGVPLGASLPEPYGGVHQAKQQADRRRAPAPETATHTDIQDPVATPPEVIHNRKHTRGPCGDCGGDAEAENRRTEACSQRLLELLCRSQVVIINYIIVIMSARKNNHLQRASA